jgi:pimeloyl-ACP methyl ester carboxylesterase
MRQRKPGAPRRTSQPAGTVGDAMNLAATHVQTLVIPDCGHFFPEEAPKQLLAALIPFLTA